MLRADYEYKHLGVCGDGVGYRAVHGGHAGRRSEHQVASADPDRRQQFRPEVRELARGCGFHRRGFGLYDLSVACAEPDPDEII